MFLTEDMVAKTNRERIVSLAFHPGEEKVLLAAGGKSGDLGKNMCLGLI